MQITETKTVVREIYVAPCLKCGSEDILITDSNYSSFNTGGGSCRACKHSVTGGCGCDVNMDTLVKIWNEGNDLEYLIKQQEAIVAVAQEKIATLVKLQDSRTF